MAAPVSNDALLNIGQRQARALEQGKPSPAPVKPEAGGSNGPAHEDTVTLSEAAKNLSSERPEQRGPRTPEEAQRLVEQLKEKLSANPGFAAAVHKVSESSKLATLLDGYA